MTTPHFDVLIIGAGISGIGAACHLTQKSPDKTFAILEGRERIGGTWDLFRYPGIRSDSDMYTLGFSFKPWRDPKIIADGGDIRDYIEETAREYGVDKKIRFGRHVSAASWSTEDSLWTVTVKNKATGKTEHYTAGLLLSCTGYYNYDAGYTPDFPGRKRFKGVFIHPQHWPENLDYAGKRVVIIGSGATAVTLMPAMTDRAEHVTMLQRSPTYIVSLPMVDKVSEEMRKYLPEKWVYRLGRTRNISLSMLIFEMSRRFPRIMKNLLLKQVKLQIGNKSDMRHFTPSYNPWDERLCAVPNGDLFKAIRKGKASIVTDHIKSFTADGIELKSGETLPADIVVSATGLEILMLGGIDITVDGKPFEIAKATAYKGLMLSGLPNFVMVVGYTNASWTLKADLTSEFVCRLLKHMDKKGMKQFMPVVPKGGIEEAPLLNLRSGYIQRAANRTPKQGAKAPWRVYQNYALDLPTLRFTPIEDGILKFSHPAKKEGKRRRAA